MTIRLFVLKDVPDDEAEEIRQLLQRHAIDHYETPPGKFGISSPALWLKDESQLQQARQLLDEYQQQRAKRIRELHQQQKLSGELETFVDRFKAAPIRVLLVLAFVLVVLYFSIKPFVSL